MMPSGMHTMRLVEGEKHMHNSKLGKIWISVVLLAGLVAGCGDADKNAGSLGPSDPLSRPTVLSETPPNATGGVCPNNALITATFSKAMNPATINTTTFTVSPNVMGQVTYNSPTNVATLTPSAPLLLNTTYTATIATGAADVYGNALATNLVSTFTTSVTACQAPTAISLGTACTFGILASTPSVTSVGPTIVTGDIGIWPAASITGFPPGTFSGSEHLGDGVAMGAQGDLTTAYNNAAGAAGGAVLAADIGGQTLPAGVYKTTSSQPTLGITGNLTLDGGGDPNSVWIFQIVSSLTTAAGNSQIILINSASAQNVYWQIGSSATLGTTTIFEGTIMAQASITLTTGATLKGRGLARTGAIALDSNPVNVPPCP